MYKVTFGQTLGLKEKIFALGILPLDLHMGFFPSLTLRLHVF